ncbi:MAG: sigma-70 family RNA polymerase sigma factor [Phycisphaerales bacterium]|nr:sigma-70 family RNA polymerase sigma factor [Phycisphaerales bacterium]
MCVVLDLFEMHYERVFRFARRSVDASTAEDIAQEVFTRLLRLPDLAEREIRAPYLIKIAENLIRRRFNKEQLFAEHAERYRTHARSRSAFPGREQTPDESVQSAVAGLGERERQAVELTVCRGLSYQQAAASMGAKVSDVNNWRYRGVERARRSIEEQAYDRAE